MAEQFKDTQHAGDMQKRFTDPKVCWQWGGHCWVEKMPHQSLPSFPPQVGPPTRTCKHCGLNQRGLYQEPVRWEDVPA